MPLSDAAKVGLSVAGAAALAATIAVFGPTHQRPAPSTAFDAGPPVCACSSGSNCTLQRPQVGPDGMFATDKLGAFVMETVAAPTGETLQPGWVGDGCVAKVCNALAGQAEAWPSGCPLE